MRRFLTNMPSQGCVGCSAGHGHRVDGRFGARADAQEEARRARGCGPTRRARSRRHGRGLAGTAAPRPAPAAPTRQEGPKVVDNSPPAVGRSADRGGRAGQAPLRRREVVGRREGALPRLDRRDRRRRGQQADRPVQPGEGPLQAQVLPGRVLDLQRDRRQAQPPQVQRDAALAREARDRPARARRHHRARRQVQRGARRQVQQQGAAGALLAAQLPARPLQVPQRRSTPRRLALFEKVDRRSKYYVQAQFFGGISNVQMRQSKPAVQAFQRILGAIEEGDVEVEDEARMRDLAYLSMARTFYSASVTLDETTNAPTVDQTRLSAAVKYWNKVDVASEYWLDALFEESWAYFMAGDYSHALGNIHTIEAPYFPHSYYPEADVLKAVIYFANCQYDDAITIVAKFRGQYEPIRDELDEDPRQVQGREPGRGVLQVPEGRPRRQGAARPEGRADRQDVAVGPPAPPQPRVRAPPRRGRGRASRRRRPASRTRRSPTSSRTRSTTRASSPSATPATSPAAATSATWPSSTSTSATGRRSSSTSRPPSETSSTRRWPGQQVTAEESKANIVRPDEEHVIWPFNGEYWRDELGFYRQTITSKCGR